MTQPTCFLSYSRDEDLSPDLRDYIVDSLRDTLGPNAVCYDQTDVPIGGSFQSFANQLDAVDAVLILLTPTYRIKTDFRDSGVGMEFDKIWRRYTNSRNLSEENANKPFEILPILCSGNKEISIPDCMKDLNYIDLRNLNIKRKSNGEFSISTKQLNLCIEAFKAISRQVQASFALRNPSFGLARKQYYDRLFVDLKANFNAVTTLGHNYFQSLIVKTFTYKKLLDQETLIVVGRKGSGKSTLTQLLPIVHSAEYFGNSLFDANSFNLDLLFSLFNQSQFSSDTTHVFSRSRAFEFTWEAVIIFMALQELRSTADEAEKNYIETEDQRILLENYNRWDLNARTANDTNDIQNSNDWTPDTFFVYAFSKTIAFVKDCIDKPIATEHVYMAEVSRDFSLERYLHFCFPPTLLAATRRLLRNENRKFLVSLDGFDSAFDTFRAGSGAVSSLDNLKARAIFEVDWLRSLLRFVLQSRERTNDYVCKRLSFCITVPKDRFLEVLHLERDSYRAWRRWRTIQWSGLELALLLRKRLEVLGEFRIDKRFRELVSTSLEEALKHPSFKHLPTLVEFRHGNRTYSIPLFMYVLRHSFWRPREILLHFGALLALGDELGRSNSSVDSQSIRQCIKSTNPQIIESEFFTELRSILWNIKDIVGSFRRRSNILDGSDVCELLSKQTFNFAAKPSASISLIEKVEFLFSIGFLGIRADDEMIERIGLDHPDAFVFNTGMIVFEGADAAEIQGWTYVIHPIFSEYLRLETANDDLTLIFDWNYLKKQEVIMRAGGLPELTDITRAIVESENELIDSSIV